MTNCPNCGATIPPGSFGCEYCGTIFYDEISDEINRLKKEQEELKAVLMMTQTRMAVENQLRNIIIGHRWG